MNESTAPRVSIVIPAYNTLEYIQPVMAAVFRQGIEEWEVVVVDDGSTDGTREWLEEQSAADPRIRVIHGGGLGAAKARNRALEDTRAPLIAFLDADDVWRDGKLATQIEYHEQNPEVVMSFTDYEHVDPQGHSFGGCYQFWPQFKAISAKTTGYRSLGPKAAAALFAENVVGTSTVVARKDALDAVDAFDVDVKSSHDWDLWLRLALQGEVGFTDADEMLYLMRPNSMTSNRERRLKFVKMIIDRYTPMIEKLDPNAVKLANARLITGEAEWARERGDKWEAFSKHLKAWSLAPSMRAFKSVAADFLTLLHLRKAHQARA